MSSVKTDIRVLHQNYIAMGPGKADLLEAILQHGSISAAAKSMHMSYKRAWDLVTIMNASFQAPLVTTAIGGTHGGGATLTTVGQEVLRLYRDVQIKAERYVQAEAQGLTGLLR